MPEIGAAHWTRLVLEREELERDRERLRGVLQKIARGYPCETAEDMRRLAREALPPALR